MGHGDIVTREYMRKNEIFADAFNYMIYGGRQVIEPEGLQELDTAELAEKYPDANAEGILRRAALYVPAGLVNIEGKRISFTPKGFLLSNTLTAEILYE